MFYPVLYTPELLRVMISMGSPSFVTILQPLSSFDLFHRPMGNKLHTQNTGTSIKSQIYKIKCTIGQTPIYQDVCLGLTSKTSSRNVMKPHSGLNLCHKYNLIQKLKFVDIGFIIVFPSCHNSQVNSIPAVDHRIKCVSLNHVLLQDRGQGSGI